MLTAIQMRRQGEYVIPAFVIEVLSETDQAYRIEEKMVEYFNAVVQVVWKIIPEQEVVYVYSSRRHVTTCLEDDVCLIASVLPDFKIAVNDLFAPSVV